MTPRERTLAGTAVVFLAWWLLAAVGVRPGLLAALDERWIVAAEDDDHGRLSHRVLRLQRRAPAPRAVLVLGPSSTREALTSDVDLRARLEAYAGAPIEVEVLAADGETPFEYAAILGALPDGFRGVVVLGLSPSMLARCHHERVARSEDREDLALGWASEARDAELRGAGVPVPARTGLYPWDARDFLLPRALAPLAAAAGRPAAWRAHRSGPPLGNLDASVRVTGGKIAHYAEGAKVALPVLERAMDTFAARAEGVRFVLLEQTELPVRYAEVVGAKRLDQYQRRIDRLDRERQDTRWLDLSTALAPGDFADLVHLSTDAGRARHTEALARWLADLLAGREPSAATAARRAWHPAPGPEVW